MTREQYLNKRNTLLDAAQALIDEGKLDEAKAKSGEVEALDNQYDAEAKAAANLVALRENTRITDVTGAGTGTFATMAQAIPAEDMYDTVEYRNAFMGNVLRGTPIPAKFTNADANTKTTDVGSVIPTTIMQKIVEKMEATGMILPLVTRTAYKGGLAIPTSTVKPVATWASEGASSDRQKKTTGSITFGYFKLRCAISMSLESTVVSLSMFEAAFIANVTEAMVKALEQAIISGNGTSQPKGILTETVVTGQNVDIAAADAPGYSTLIDAEAALPLAYDATAKWAMTKKTFMTFIGMVDENGQPIARVNYGINGRPEYVLLGRQVVVNDYMANYAATVATATVVAFLFNFSDYVLNTNYDVTVKRFEDNDTDDEVTKAIMLVDGKVIDKNSLVTITKKAA